jgi:hypothetical protein
MKAPATNSDVVRDHQIGTARDIIPRSPPDYVVFPVSISSPTSARMNPSWSA